MFLNKIWWWRCRYCCCCWWWWRRWWWKARQNKSRFYCDCTPPLCVSAGWARMRTLPHRSRVDIDVDNSAGSDNCCDDRRTHSGQPIFIARGRPGSQAVRPSAGGRSAGTRLRCRRSTVQARHRRRGAALSVSDKATKASGAGRGPAGPLPGRSAAVISGVQTAVVPCRLFACRRRDAADWFMICRANERRLLGRRLRLRADRPGLMEHCRLRATEAARVYREYPTDVCPDTSLTTTILKRKINFVIL